MDCRIQWQGDFPQGFHLYELQQSFNSLTLVSHNLLKLLGATHWANTAEQHYYPILEKRMESDAIGSQK